MSRLRKSSLSYWLWGVCIVAAGILLLGRSALGWPEWTAVASPALIVIGSLIGFRYLWLQSKRSSGADQPPAR
ncbi:hypothetical protein L3i23_05970 [Herbiconiux sp. L3-i23]|nr:hypothetical protein L3i23_05970 [Herbiconiux sp. L3-i23]